MNDRPADDQWVYAAIEDPGANEKFVGLYDEADGVSYIPVFDTKDEAQSCMINMPRQPNKKYEVQAVLFEELAKDARENGFLIFVLNGDGQILKRVAP